MVTRGGGPPVCLVVGTSGGGKTTLVEKLIKELSSRGLTLATAKGHKEPIEVDVPGKDTWRHRKAGAVMTFLVTGGESAVFMERSMASDPDEMALMCPPSVDLLLAEGFKTHKGRPKIWVSPGKIPLDDPDLLCVADENPERFEGVKALNRNDVTGIADLIINLVLKP